MAGITGRGQGPYDLVVVGGGIAGLTHALTAVEQGLRVLLLERDSATQGASIRNFGMVWPIGQPLGELYQRALSSRNRWQQYSGRAGFWSEACGCLFVAHHADEWNVLQEYHELARSTVPGLELWTPAEIAKQTPAVRAEGLQGGLFSPHEMRVDPRTAIPALTEYLRQQPEADVITAACVIRIEDGKLQTTAGHTYAARRVLVCGGAELSLLYPEILQAAGLKRTKLQMLRTVSQPDSFRIGPHLASGLTLRHYASFAECPSLRQVQSRIAQASPELNRFGIHVMASQTESGQLILGDSHEYADEIEIFNKEEIDSLILRELQAVFAFPTWEIEQRWTGEYAKCLTGPAFRAQPTENVEIITGLGGNGMTLCWSLAEETLHPSPLATPAS